MNHERDQQRELDRTTSSNDAETLAPGRIARTDHLVGPGPRASGFVQRKAAGNDIDLDDDAVRATAARGFSGGGGSLPHLAAIQRSFGRHDVSSTVAHVGGAATQATGALGAHAYASGNSVAFAQQPDLFLAAHEAAHVVQQRGGVQLSSALGRPDDAYERHADEVAAAVVAGGSAESLLDRHAGGGGTAVQLKGKDKIPDEDTATVPGRANVKANKGTEAEKAAYIRAHNPDGFVMVLSIPQGYQNDADAKARMGSDAIDPSAMRAAIDKMSEADTKAVTDAVVAAHPELAPDPSDAKKDATKKQKDLGKLIDAAMKAKVKTDYADVLAHAMYTNNAVFTSESAQMAKGLGALGLAGGTVQIGKAMDYAEAEGKQHIASTVSATAIRVRELLAANDPQAGDERVALIRAVALASHASSEGAGGFGAAREAKYKSKDVPEIVKAIAPYLASDVKVSLFACHAGSVGKKEASDGTFGDAWRDALADQGKDDAIVMAHRTTGPALMNGDTRYLGASAGSGHADWSWPDIFDDAFITSQAARLAISDTRLAPHAKEPGKQSELSEMRVLRNGVILYYHRYAWQCDTSTLTSFRATAHAGFEKHFPDRNSLFYCTEDYMNEKGDQISRPKHLAPVETPTTSKGNGDNAAEVEKKKKK